MTGPYVLPDSAKPSRSPRQISAQQDEEVARLAYTKWRARHQTHDPQQQDWLEAEAELAHVVDRNEHLFEVYQRMAQLIAERREADRRLLAEHAVSSILAAADTLIAAAPKLLRAICDSLDWDAGVVWLLDRDADLLRCVEVWHAPHVEIPAFEKESRLQTFSSGIGVPGRVWASESVVWIPDVTAAANFPTGRMAAQEGLHGGVGFPVRNGVEFLAVLEFLSREVRQPDEAVTEMMTSIGEQISQFIERQTAERRLLAHEQGRRTAREIQQGLLPKTTPRLSGMEISGKSVAPNLVGGDWFDFIPLWGGGRDSIGVLVADASGHGIAAALLAGQTRAYLRAVALSSNDVGYVLDLTNKGLSNDITTDHFVTAFFMRLDAKARSLTYASAGHLPGYVLDSRGQAKAVLASTGLPLGIDPLQTFPVAHAVSLEADDLVLLISDGISEARSPDDELFGMERTLRCVRQHQQQTPCNILNALFDAVTVFCNNNCLDDMTAVIAKMNGQQRKESRQSGGARY